MLWGVGYLTIVGLLPHHTFAEQRPALRTLFLNQEEAPARSDELRITRIGAPSQSETFRKEDTGSVGHAPVKAPVERLAEAMPSTPVKPWVPGRSGVGVRVEMTW